MDTKLGKLVPLPGSPQEATLDTMPFQQAISAPTLVRLSVPEFTSLCPVTGQPDFAHFVIDYAPNERIVESKSLKLFMGAFRNHGMFHEECTMLVAIRLGRALDPHWLRVSAYWFPRGGIPIDVFWQTGEPPRMLHIPPIDIPVYRAR